MLLVFILNITWLCFSLVAHECLLFSNSSLFFISSSSYSHNCPSCNVLFYVCETLRCSRLKYNLDVADRLADEHVLIGLYVNLLQNNPRSWLVGVLLCLPNTMSSMGSSQDQLQSWGANSATVFLYFKSKFLGFKFVFYFLIQFIYLLFGSCYPTLTSIINYL